MKQRLHLIILLASLALSGMAQTIGEAFYIYRNDGQFNAFFRDEVDSIAYSYYDADSVRYDEVVTQMVYTADSIYRIPLAAIDSVGFVQPETEFQPDVMRMNTDWLYYVLRVTDNTITFRSDAPKSFLPAIGQTIVAEVYNAPFETGFSGRVTAREEFRDSIVFSVEPVTLPDIYKHVVAIGMSSSETESAAGSKSVNIWGMNTNPGVRFPLPNVNIPIGPVTISCNPEVILKYIVCVNEPNMKNYVDIKAYHTYRGSVSIDCKLDKDYKPEPKWAKAYIPITTSVPGLYGKIQFGGFIRASGSVQLSAKQPFVINGVAGIEYSEEKGFHRVNEWNASMEDTEIDLSLNGSISTGLAVRLLFGVIHERIASADITAYVGPKFEANFSLSSAGIVEKNLYSSIKDAEATLSFDVEIVPGYRFVVQKWIGEVPYPEDHQELPVSLDFSWPINHWYIVPEFENLEWKPDEGKSAGTLSADIHRNLLPKVSLGWGLYDENDNLKKNSYFYSKYRKIEDWGNNGMEMYIDNLPKGGRYKAYPLIELAGIEMRADKSVDITSDLLVKNVGSPQVSATDAAISGYVEGLGNGMVVDAGICYTTDPDAEQWKYVSSGRKEDGDFSVTISDLSPATTYYYCAYAYKDGEYYYADEALSFQTKAPVVSFSDFKVTSSQYQSGGFSNDGQWYDYKFNTSVTVTLSDSEGIEDWGYVYRDPNGREKEISLQQFGTNYTDTRYAYYRNQASSTVCFYGYVKASGSDKKVYGEPVYFNLMHSGDTSCPDGNHPHYIDLGLPSGTKWACCNVGASKPEDYGGYYAWGETSEKSVYNWDTYKYGYNNGVDDYSHLVNIGSDIAGTSYDAATANWGAPWRMPSKAQIQELLNNTTSTWTTQNGVKGRKFTGSNGGTVFLPAAGLRGSYGYYWSSTLYERRPDHAYYLGFYSGFDDWGDGSRYRYYGYSVRPVR